MRNGVEYLMDTSNIGKGQDECDTSEKSGRTNDGLSNSNSPPPTGGISDVPSPLNIDGINNSVSTNDETSDQNVDQHGEQVVHGDPVFLASPESWAKQNWISRNGYMAQDISLSVLIVLSDSKPLNKELKSFLDRAAKLNFSVFVTPQLHAVAAAPKHVAEQATESAAHPAASKEKHTQKHWLEEDLW